MTELDILRHAKGYIDKLSEGVDPLTENELPESDIVNNERISKCLSYVSGILGKVIANGGEIGKRGFLVKKPFSIDGEILSKYEFEEPPITVSAVVRKINDLVNPDEYEKLKSSAVFEYLVKTGLLSLSDSGYGKTVKRPTDAGREIGIGTEQRVNQAGHQYELVVLNADAQRFLLDNIDEMIEINNLSYNSLENQNKPWTPYEDGILIDLFQNGKSPKDCAIVLKRNSSAIRARLKQLGLAAK